MANSLDDEEPLHADVKKRKRTSLTDGQKATASLLVFLLFERIAFYAITFNMSTFATSCLGFKPAEATIIVTCTVGTAYLIAPLFGWLSDRKFGYFNVLATAAIFYIVASCFVCAAAFDTALVFSNVTDPSVILNTIGRPRAFYLVGLGMMVPCVSAIRANLVPFMLEQLGNGAEKRRVMDKFVSVCYFVINVGATLSNVLAFGLQGQRGPGKKAEANTGFFWMYLSAPVCLLAALIILFTWRKRYRISRKRDFHYNLTLRSILSTACGCYKETYPNSDDVEKRRADGYRRRLAVIVPVVGSLIAYNIVYGQTTSSFVDQAFHLELYSEKAFKNVTVNSIVGCGHNKSTVVVNHPHYVVPPSAISFFDTVTIVLFVPAVWWIVYPIYERVAGKEFSMMNRIFWGMIFAMISVLSAMSVELARRLSSADIRYAYVCTKFADTSRLLIVSYSSISLAAQIPQYVFVGAAEVLSGIAFQEFLLSRAPREFRCTVYSLYYTLIGNGYYLGTALSFAASELYFKSDGNGNGKPYRVKELKPSDIKTWAYFLIIFVFMALSCLFFHHVKKKHRDVPLVEPMSVERKRSYGSDSIKSSNSTRV
ncbi:solute carrier family 15 member 4-like [Oscarella lobularis]|uniref:solute carrier family 15 member 4-like n=1 Tax=Oscarella lobularis TaxID=121494 RepID=UPI0033137323